MIVIRYIYQRPFPIKCDDHLPAIKMLRAATRGVKKFITDVQKATTPRGYFHEELVLWDFTKEESLKQWVCICDKDIEGLSTTRFERNRKGRQLC